MAQHSWVISWVLLMIRFIFFSFFLYYYLQLLLEFFFLPKLILKPKGKEFETMKYLYGKEIYRVSQRILHFLKSPREVLITIL